jgi:thiamine monophosphate synthase
VAVALDQGRRHVFLRLRIYLVTPPRVRPSTQFAEALKADVDADDVAMPANPPQGRRMTTRFAGPTRLVPIAQAACVAVLMNDRPDLAAQNGV